MLRYNYSRRHDKVVRAYIPMCITMNITALTCSMIQVCFAGGSNPNRNVDVSMEVIQKENSSW